MPITMDTAVIFMATVIPSNRLKSNSLSLQGINSIHYHFRLNKKIANILYRDNFSISFAQIQNEIFYCIFIHLFQRNKRILIAVIVICSRSSTASHKKEEVHLNSKLHEIFISVLKSKYRIKTTTKK